MIIKKILIDNYLVGILSTPDEFLEKIPMVLFLHGFGTDKNEVGNTFELAANKLCKKSIGSLRIDFSGFGETKGNTADTTIEKLMQDANIALDYIFSQSFTDINRVGICGFSLGAGITVLITNNKTKSVKSMALLSPAGDLPEDFNTYFGCEDYNRLEKSSEGIELDLGWRKITLKNTFIQSLKRHFLIDSIASFKGSFFVAAGTNDFSFKHANRYINTTSSSNKELLVINNGDHIFNAFEDEKSTIEIVTKKLSRWFKKTL